MGDVTADRTALAASGGGVEPSIQDRAAGHRFAAPIVLLGGLLGGLAWGINARVWMRFISADPEFSWTGTLFIVIGFGIAGLAQSGAYLGRRAGLRRPPMTVLRVVTFASLLPLGVAAGAPMFPAVVLARLAITHTDRSGRMRAVGRRGRGDPRGAPPRGSCSTICPRRPRGRSRDYGDHRPSNRGEPVVTLPPEGVSEDDRAV